MRRHFHNLWLELDGVARSHKDATLYPDFTADIPPLMQQQVESVLEDSYSDPSGTFETLLTTPNTFVNAKLATYYGIKNGPTGDAFAKVKLDPAQHVGLFTEGGIMADLATINRTHPILRGLFVRRLFLCDSPADPPPGIVDGRDSVKDPNATQRERLAAHRNSTACAGCHAMMDPIGFVFEGYDPSGRFRSTEYGKSIDVSGRVEGTDVEGDFNGPAELAKKIVSSTQAHECIINTWFRFREWPRRNRRRPVLRAADRQVVHHLRPEHA